MIRQEKLPPEKLRALRWGSHIPLNASVLKSFPITGVLELGAGFNSTPLFFKSTSHVVSVESDAAWIEKLRSDKTIVETPAKRFVHHEVPPWVSRSTTKEELTPELLDSAVSLYRSVRTRELNFLFIDCHAGFRLKVLVELHQEFDVIAYHDAEPKDDKWYGYSTFKPGAGYLHCIDRTFAAHTGLLVTEKFATSMDLFVENFAIESAEYANRFDAIHEVTLDWKTPRYSVQQ
jgi:hypothetical protein